MKVTYDDIFKALKKYYGVEEDRCVWEILGQTEDFIYDISEALSEQELEEEEPLEETVQEPENKTVIICRRCMYNITGAVSYDYMCKCHPSKQQPIRVVVA